MPKLTTVVNTPRQVHFDTVSVSADEFQSTLDSFRVPWELGPLSGHPLEVWLEELEHYGVKWGRHQLPARSDAPPSFMWVTRLPRGGLRLDAWEDKSAGLWRWGARLRIDPPDPAWHELRASSALQLNPTRALAEMFANWRWQACLM